MAKKRGSCEHHGNINFFLGGITNEIHAPEVISPSHVSQPRCSLFSYADTALSKRSLETVILPLSFKMSYHGWRGEVVMFLVRQLNCISQL